MKSISINKNETFQDKRKELRGVVVNIYDSIPKESKNERGIYLQTLRKMSPSEKFNKVTELNELTKSLFKQGLRKRFPEKSEEEIHSLFLKRLEKCHNSNY
ncbi:MAG: hypothetical protein IPL26_06410 [Leptospiraceae bacterium]|nr:hypothetical protein [Leptospiraceae bacterium]